MVKHSLLILFCLTFCIATSQKTDSNLDTSKKALLLFEKSANKDIELPKRLSYLNEALRISNERDTLTPYILYSKCSLHFTLGQYDSLFYYGKKLTSITKRYPDNLNRAKYFYLKAYYFENAEDIVDSSYSYYHDAKKLFLATGDTLKAGNCALRLGTIQRIKNDFYGAKETLTEALSYLENQNYLASAYNELGIVNRNLINEKGATNNYRKAINISNSKKDIIVFKNNLAYDLYSFGKYEEAKPIYESILADPLLVNDSISYARTLHNFALLQWKMDNATQQQIISKFNLAKRIRKAKDFKLGIITSYNDLSSFYFETNPTIAIKYADSSLALAQKMNLPSEEVDALEIIMKLRPNELAARNRYIYLKDSLYKNELKVKTQFAQMKYEDEVEKAKLSKLEAEAAQIRVETAEQKTQKFIFIAISSMLFLGGISLYYLLRQKHKKQKLQKVYTTERHISKQLHDGLGNDIFGLMSSVQNKNIDENHLLDNLELLYNRTRDFSHSYSSVLGGKDFIEELQQLFSKYQNEKTNIILQGHNSIDWLKIENHKSVTLYRALQELLVNMAKHSQASLVFIKFSQDKKNINLFFKDNGVGCVHINKKGTGLDNTVSRIENCNGTFKFTSSLGKGTQINLSIPK